MHYLFYIIGVGLLAWPAGLLTRKRLSFITMRELVDRPSQRLGWMHWVNLVDVARAWAGLTLVLGAFRLVDDAVATNYIALGAVAVAALGGLVLQQCLHAVDGDEVVAPVAYVAGLAGAFLPLEIAVMVVPLGLVTALGFQSTAAGFAFAAVAAVGLGVMFRLPPVVIVGGGVLLGSPALVAGLMQRQLVFAVRRRVVSRGEPLREFSVRRSAR